MEQSQTQNCLKIIQTLHITDQKVSLKIIQNSVSQFTQILFSSSSDVPISSFESFFSNFSIDYYQHFTDFAVSCCTVDPPHNGHSWTTVFVRCREVSTVWRCRPFPYCIQNQKIYLLFGGVRCIEASVKCHSTVYFKCSIFCSTSQI